MFKWGRRVQFLGAVLLLVAPFLAWTRARVLGLELGLPGLLLHGSVPLALGLLLATALLLRQRAPLLGLAVALVSFGFTLQDLHWTVRRSEYALRRLQLSLADLNQVLAQLNLEPIELFTRESSPWAHVGPGIWMALAGSGLVALGAVLELGGQRCRGCRVRLTPGQRFCPACGLPQESASACPACRQPVKPNHRFCPSCGQRLPGLGEESTTGTALV